jgi:sRNA-binding carbon storage regulator CsrA
MLVLSRKEGMSVIVSASGCEALFTVIGFDGDDVVVNRHDMCPLRASELRFTLGSRTKVQVGGVSFTMMITSQGGNFKLAFDAPKAVRFVRTDCPAERDAEAA